MAFDQDVDSSPHNLVVIRNQNSERLHSFSPEANVRLNSASYDAEIDQEVG
jgi:hypothetical protein